MVEGLKRIKASVLHVNSMETAAVTLSKLYKKGFYFEKKNSEKRSYFLIVLKIKKKVEYSQCTSPRHPPCRFTWHHTSSNNDTATSVEQQCVSSLSHRHQPAWCVYVDVHPEGPQHLHWQNGIQLFISRYHLYLSCKDGPSNIYSPAYDYAAI